VKQTWLLDVNVLVAWLWPRHEGHLEADDWISNLEGARWATCPMTEMGFLRVVTSPRFSRIAPSYAEASELLWVFTENDWSHRFWPDALSLAELEKQFGSRMEPGSRVMGHGRLGGRNVRGAYLLGLAMKNGGKLVTFDHRLEKLAPVGSREREALVVLTPQRTGA
jgi:toxin-antitoxin system PIN domain toxin